MEGSGWDYRLAYGDSQKLITGKKAARRISFFYEALRYASLRIAVKPVRKCRWVH